MSKDGDARRVHNSKTGNYARRAKAEFSDENDHNPMVLQDCPQCRGWGRVCRHYEDGDTPVRALETCSHCGGTGTTGKIEPYFSHSKPEVAVVADDDGWLTCPNCGWRFSISDKSVWTGRRHIRTGGSSERLCGQRIKVISN